MSNCPDMIMEQAAVAYADVNTNLIFCISLSIDHPPIELEILSRP